MRDPDLATITAAAATVGLAVLSGFHPEPEDGAPAGTGTVLLLGPGPGFWPGFRASPEVRDGAADPMDRWSVRVIGGLAETFAARALYPFGGPPYRPFIAWAKRGARAWGSPVTLLVHAEAGLFVSYRGALAFGGRIAVPAAAEPPCPSCARPCVTACPVGALGHTGYEIARCHAYLKTPPGAECLERGCAARRACPVGAAAREVERSAFHMASFHPRPAG